MRALPRRDCSGRRMDSRFLSGCNRLLRVGRARKHPRPCGNTPAAPGARSERSRRHRHIDRAYTSRVLARERNASAGRGRTPHDLRRSTLAREPRTAPPRARLVADARSQRSRRVRNLPRWCAYTPRPGGDRRNTRACVHELPSRAERGARLWDVPWRRRALVPAALTVLLSGESARSCPRRARGGERLTGRWAALLDLPPDSGGSRSFGRPWQRPCRRVVRLRDRRARGTLRDDGQALRGHLSRARWRSSHARMDRSHAADVQRLPHVATAESLPRCMHELPSGGER